MINREDIKKMKQDPTATHVIGVDRNLDAVLVPRDPPPLMGGAGATGTGGGVSSRDIERLKKEIRIDINKAKCCPPVLLQGTISGNVAGLNFSDDLVAVKIDQGATLVPFLIIGTNEVITVNDFSVTPNQNGFQDVSIDISVDDNAGNPEVALVIQNPCGCCVFVGSVTFSQA